MAKPIAVQILRGFDNSITTISKVIAEQLHESGYSSEVLFLRETSESKHGSFYDQAHYLGMGAQHWRGLRSQLIVKLWRWVRGRTPDVAITHRYKELFVLLLVRKLTTRFPLFNIVHSERDFDSWLRRTLCCWLMDDNCTFITVSDSTAAYVNRTLSKLHKSQIKTVSNGVDFEHLSSSQLPSAAARAQLGIPVQATVYGSVGRLATTKGTKLLVQAFLSLAQEHQSSVLVLFGEGRLRAEIEQLRDNSGLRDRIILLGNVENASSYLQAIDFFVFPSVREGFGLALIEAVAAKIPAIYSDIDTFKHLTTDRRYMAPVNDVQGLVDKMQLIKNDPAETRQATVEAQYSYAASRFSLAQTRQAYREIFQELA